jgi:Xaa-Pro aminopeptidase
VQQARFQSFTPTTQPELASSRLAALRQTLAALDLDGMLLPRADIFQGEYLPACEDRLAWVTGFSGSAGFAIVLSKACALFVDGRYTLQARDEVDASVITVVPLAEQSPEAWLKANGTGRIGYDPAHFTDRALTKFESGASSQKLAFVALAADPIAPLWPDRPEAPATPVVDHPLEFAGESREAKLARLQQEMGASRLDALVISENPGVCWLFNLRAADVQHLPVLRGFALVPRAGKPTLFVDPARLQANLAAALDGFAVITATGAAPGDGRAELMAALAPLARAGAKIRLDADTAPVLLAQAIEAAGGTVDIGADPIARMKAAKNAAELAGTRAAHLRDGVAVTRFLAWLERNASKADEIDAVIALEGFRSATGALHDLSFGTIAGAGPNAALPHYRVTQKTNRKITPGLFLVDSGGQYRDGTTDITRTVQIAHATPAMRQAYTRVLKGMIAVSLAVFPQGASGAQLDTLARQYLWAAGQDFDHGTGHGVGSFLSVHEGPQRISKFGGVTLEPGMILSNEPGYYREGAFGIRIENLVVVEKRGGPIAFPSEVASGSREGNASKKETHFEREMLGFETITLAPIDTRPVIRSWLSPNEKAWLNAYHARVEAALSPHLVGDDLVFLKAACAAI